MWTAPSDRERALNGKATGLPLLVRSVLGVGGAVSGALKPGQTETVNLHLRNFRTHQQTHHIEIHTPRGLMAEPTILEGSLSGESRRAFPIRIRAAFDTAPGLRVVALDVTLNGQRYGERFDFVVGVGGGR